jgi:hypothetical protein
MFQCSHSENGRSNMHSLLHLTMAFRSPISSTRRALAIFSEMGKSRYESTCSLTSHGRALQRSTAASNQVCCCGGISRVEVMREFGCTSHKAAILRTPGRDGSSRLKGATLCWTTFGQQSMRPCLHMTDPRSSFKGPSFTFPYISCVPVSSARRCPPHYNCQFDKHGTYKS